MIERPPVSCLMAVYAGEHPESLDAALASIWESQEMRPDQIVLVQDGSLTPELNAILAAWHARLGDTLTLVPLDTNIGLGAALNVGLRHCAHELVARADTDDIQSPTRFAHQVRYMEAHPEVAVCSGWIEEFGADGKTFAIRKLPATHDELAAFAQKRCPISHPAAMYRKSAVLAVGGYPPLRKSQDYGLWALLMVNGYRFGNLQEVLCRMRVTNMFGSGRGFHQLRNEWAMFRFQKRIGFIGWGGFVRNFGIRAVLRLSPAPIKRLMYRYGRG